MRLRNCYSQNWCDRTGISTAEDLLSVFQIYSDLLSNLITDMDICSTNRLLIHTQIMSLNCNREVYISYHTFIKQSLHWLTAQPVDISHFLFISNIITVCWYFCVRWGDFGSLIRITLVFTTIPSAALVSYLISLAFTERTKVLTVRPQSSVWQWIGKNAKAKSWKSVWGGKVDKAPEKQNHNKVPYSKPTSN